MLPVVAPGRALLNLVFADADVFVLSFGTWMAAPIWTKGNNMNEQTPAGAQPSWPGINDCLESSRHCRGTIGLPLTVEVSLKPVSINRLPTGSVVTSS